MTENTYSVYDMWWSTGVVCMLYVAFPTIKLPKSGTNIQQSIGKLVRSKPLIHKARIVIYKGFLTLPTFSVISLAYLKVELVSKYPS